MIKIEVAKDLVAGMLYCLVTRETDGSTGEPYDREGALVYWTGDGWMDEDGDDRYDDWDYAVPQAGVKPNPDYILVDEAAQAENMRQHVLVKEQTERRCLPPPLDFSPDQLSDHRSPDPPHRKMTLSTPISPQAVRDLASFPEPGLDGEGAVESRTDNEGPSP